MKGFKSAIKWVAAIVLICVVAVFLASINGLNVSRTVITVNGSEITEQEYKFYVEAIKMQVLSEQNIADEKAAEEFLKNGMIEGKTVSDYVKEEALNQALRNEIAVVKAKEAGISLTEEEINSARSTQGMEDAIDMYKVSKNTYADIMEKTQLVNKYYTHLTTTDAERFSVENEDITSKINEEYALVQHVLIMNKPEGSETADEEYAAKAKKTAEEVLAKAVAGESFQGLITEYNEDPGMEANPNGYLITKTGHTLDGQSQMVPEFTEGSFAVKAGEVNPQLVESDYGWHIIKRVEITETHTDYMNLLQNVENVMVSDKFEAYLDSLKKTLDIVKKDNILNKVKVKY